MSIVFSSETFKHYVMYGPTGPKNNRTKALKSRSISKMMQLDYRNIFSSKKVYRQFVINFAANYNSNNSAFTEILSNDIASSAIPVFSTSKPKTICEVFFF